MGLIALIIFIVYAVVSIVLAIGAHFLGKKKGWKWCNWWVILIVMVLIPIWDVPIGKMYFNHLCGSEAGVFVYKQVALPEEYFLMKGERNERYSERSKLGYAKGGELNYSKVNENYHIGTSQDKSYSFWGHIERKETTISKTSESSVLARAITFKYGGGWLQNAVFGGRYGSNLHCQGVKEMREWHSMLPDKAFVKKKG